MKKHIYILLLLPFLALAQSQDQNYVKSMQYKMPTQNTINTFGAIPDIEQANTTITYYDGLGRPIQKIDHQQSKSSLSVVTPMEYDGFGRTTKEYQPYVSSLNTSLFETDAINNCISFYGTGDAVTTGNPYFEGTEYPYSEKRYDDSPLNQIIKQSAPGYDWRMDGGNEIKYEYSTNGVSEVKAFGVTNSFNASCKFYEIVFYENGYYASKELYKTITRDENTTESSQTTTTEFKDKEGKVILKRVYSNGNHDTYYVYDDYGNLTYVLPPLVNLNATISQQVLDGLCYQYVYDYRNRLVKKKLPGKQWEFIVYDLLDRPIVTGPVQNPFGGSAEGFIYTRYDVFDRVCFTGWFPATSDQTYCTLEYKFSNYLKNTFRSNQELLENIPINYNIQDLPNNFILLSINYYDDYAFSGAYTNPQSVYNVSTISNAKGLQTGSWTRTLVENQSLGETNTVFYDSKSRPIFNHTSNYLGGFTNISTQYNFIGQTVSTKTDHKRVQSNDVLTTGEKFNYTLQGKLSEHSHKINNYASELLSHNTYDELGNLIIKNVGGTDFSNYTGLQKIDYQYNVRGWLKKINNPEDLVETDNSLDLFAFAISYNQIENDLNNFIRPLYNGNISETYWRTASDNILRKYSYRYDDLNRLRDAIFQKPLISTPLTNSYNENITYDKNGNITSLFRNGNLDSFVESNLIDGLTYTYDAQSPNQLKKVADSTNDPNGFKDDTNTDESINDYTYDANGNMTSDYNKGILEIKYNSLNLPTAIDFGSDKIYYIYDALGKKVKKTVLENNVTTTTDYLDGFQYKNNVLQFFPSAEGYVNYVGNENMRLETNFNYVYNFLDHLGNIRLSYSKDPTSGNLKIIEENHYYPFGLKHTNYSDERQYFAKEDQNIHITQLPGFMRTGYQYKYQGQERQDELGLNWDSFKWRNYDYAIGRFMSIDPLAEKYSYQSPYNFSENRVIDARELEGLEASLVKDTQSKCVDVTIKVRAVNSTVNSPVSDKQINNAMNNFQAQTQKSFSGDTTDGTKVNVNVVIDPKATLTVNFVDVVDNPNIDSSNTPLQMANDKAPGFTDDKSVGNTQTGTVQISSQNSTFEGAPTDAKPGAGGTATHEMGHVMGLSDNKPPVQGNLMNSPKSSTDRTVTPAQRTEMIENITSN